MQMLDTFEIDKSWKGAYADVQDCTYKTARLKKAKYSKGVYPFEGTFGYEYFELKAPLIVTQLQQLYGRQWRTWMVDDPLHWFAMKEAADRLQGGRVICAGLGLGLMLRHLVERDNDVTSILVIEQNGDVIHLMQEYLPTDRRISYLHGDYYHYIENNPNCADSILWDLAVGDFSETQGDIIRGYAMSSYYQPNAQLVQFGVRSLKRR